MTFGSKLLRNSLIAAAVATWLGQSASAQELYYYSDQPRDLEVSAEGETLLSFPAAPFARVCQPAGVVEFYPLGSVDELQGMLVPQGLQYKSLAGGPGGASDAGAAGPGSELLSRHLKLVPKRESGQTTCAIRLVNEQVVNVRLTLSKMLAKPIIEFRSIYEKARGGALVTQSLGSLNVFRALVQGGDLTFLADETPSEPAVQGERSTPFETSTVVATYRLAYVGTDKDSFKAWKFSGTAGKVFKSSRPIKDAKVGDFFFSAFRPVSADGKVKAPTAKYQFAKGEEFYFYVLSRGDITVSEMLGRLP